MRPHMNKVILQTNAFSDYNLYHHGARNSYYVNSVDAGSTQHDSAHTCGQQPTASPFTHTEQICSDVNNDSGSSVTMHFLGDLSPVVPVKDCDIYSPHRIQFICDYVNKKAKYY